MQTWVQAHLVAKTIGCSDQVIHDTGFGCGPNVRGRAVPLRAGVLRGGAASGSRQHEIVD